MSSDYVPTAEAAGRARVSAVELVTTWAARHGVELAYDAGGKVIGLRRDAFEKAISNVDPVVAAWLSTGKNSARQQREAERARLGQRGHSSGDTGEAVRRRLEGNRPPTASNDDLDRLSNLVGTRRKGESDAAAMRRWLKLNQ